jgi:SNF2 family DNA or RNA helicase/tetratricopeptide (TPR) repeat protein
MSHKQSRESRRITDYQALSPIAKTMVRIMAVNVDYGLLHDMLDCLAHLGFVDDKTGAALNVSSTQPILNDLITKGLLLKSTKGICCPESIRHHAVHETLQENLFCEISRIVPVNIGLPTRITETTFFPNYRQLIGCFQSALFTGDSIENITAFIDNAAINFPDEFHENNLLLTLLNRPFSSLLIDKLDPQIRLTILLYLLNTAGFALEETKEILSYITSHYGARIKGESNSLPLISHYLMCGNINSARELLDALEDNSDLTPERLSFLGWLEYISGNYKTALEKFDECIKVIKKRTGKRKIFLRSRAGIFYLLALLQTGENRYLNKGLDFIETAVKNNYPYYSLLEIMQNVFKDQLGLTVFDLHRPLLALSRQHPLNTLIFHLLMSWSDLSEDEITIPKLRQLRDAALTHDYTWLTAELSALLASLGDSKKQNGEMAAKLHASCNTVSTVNIVKKLPKWEKTLNSLLTIAGNSEQTVTGGSVMQRVVWFFGYSEAHNYCHIIPRLQKMSKKGSWTKGRPMALKSLYHEFRTMEGLTDQDRRVCEAIKEEYYRTNWRNNKREYTLDENMALPALVAHPLLFLEDSPGVRVEFVLSEPEMRIKDENNKLTLSIFPDYFDFTSEVQIIQDTPTRFKIIRFSQEHKDIIQALGEGLTVPRSGEQLVRQVVDSLSSVVTVQSDIVTSQKIKSIDADLRPHAHILPYLKGIQLEFFIKPFGTAGSSYRPGKGGKSVLTEIKGKKLQAVRDFTKEKEQQKNIVRSCPTLNRLEEIDNQWLIDDPEESLELLLELKDCGDNVVLEWPQGEKLAVHREVSFNNLSMHIKKDRDWFKATGTLQIGDTLALDLRKLLDMLSEATGRFIPLDGGTFLAITRQLRNRLDDLRCFSEGHGKGVRFNPLAALALDELADEAGELKSDKAWKQHCKHLNEVVNPELPSTLQGSLRDYQMVGFNWLSQLSHWGVGGCLADDMGLGKTIQALAAILLRAGLGPSLVVAPLSVTSNWQEEVHRFAPTLNVIVFGPGNRQQTIDNLKQFDLVIVSYGLLPIEADLLGQVEWQTVVLDEAQAIKNMQTKRSKAAMQLQAGFRIITTGTPVENHLGELWALFNFLNPGLLGSFKKFNEKFAIPIERDHDQEARNRLRKLIRPFILRRLKNDVLKELPPKTEITLHVEMSTEEQLLYEAQRLRALENISANDEEGAGQKHLRILAEITKLRRFCCNPKLALPESKITSSKLKVFGDTLKELLSNNHKALVFSQFVGHLEIIQEHLDNQKISYQYLDGSTSIKKRKERITSFQSGEGDVFLISLKAGGAGLNLTAADYVIHMDPWWNPAVEDQASDRAHRIGQERPVTVYRLVVKDSIEEQIVGLHKQKRDLADSLLEGADSAGKVSAEELLSLLQGKG